MSKTIYVLRLSSLGDIAMSVYTIREVQKKYPDDKIVFITRHRFYYCVDYFLDVDIRPIDRPDGTLSFFRLLYYTFNIDSKRGDIVVDLHHVLRTNIMRFLFCLKGLKSFKINKHRKEKKYLTQFEEKTLYDLPHRVVDYLNVFRNAGYTLDNPEVIKKRISDNRPIKVGIAPFSKHSSKEIDINIIKRTIDIVSQKTDFQFFIYGYGDREKKLASVLNRSNITSTIQQFSFSEEMKSIESMDLFISMDSANGHLANLLGVPVISIWGTTDPCLGYGPYRQNREDGVFPDKEKYPYLPVSVYGKCSDKYYSEAINSITPEAIASKINQVINENIG